MAQESRCRRIQNYGLIHSTLPGIEKINFALDRIANVGLPCARKKLLWPRISISIRRCTFIKIFAAIVVGMPCCKSSQIILDRNYVAFACSTICNTTQSPSNHLHEPYVNTGGDLIANGIGALIAVLLILVKAGKAQ